jgi:hypothetical protein
MVSLAAITGVQLVDDQRAVHKDRLQSIGLDHLESSIFAATQHMSTTYARSQSMGTKLDKVDTLEATAPKIATPVHQCPSRALSSINPFQPLRRPVSVSAGKP